MPVLDLSALFDAVIFNLIIGNHDAHAKNFSLLRHIDGAVRLSPLYDLVSTVFYPGLTENMAMKFGGEAKSISVLPANVEKFAEDTGLGKPLAKSRVPELAQTISDAIDNTEQPHDVSERVAALIRQRCAGVLARF